MSFVKELLAFMKARKKYWLAPIIVTLVLIGGLLFYSSGASVAPFIYTLF